MSAPPRRLIVNADDFGRSSGVVAGVAAAHERGIVTSASLMVRWPAAERAARYASAWPRLAVGLHVDLGEWVHGSEGWTPVYEVCDLFDAAAVEAEVSRQLDAFSELTGRAPTHLDSHQHVHRREPARTVLRDLGRRLGVPVRHESDVVRHVGDFYGQTATGEPAHDQVSSDSLLALLDALPAGVSELVCHPGEGSDAGPPYDAERRLEVEALCAPEVRRAIERLGISLCSFADVGGA